jgi:hypothetical protein
VGVARPGCPLRGRSGARLAQRGVSGSGRPPVDSHVLSLLFHRCLLPSWTGWVGRPRVCPHTRSRRREELRGFGFSLTLGLPTSASSSLGARACHHRGPHARAAKRSFIGLEALKRLDVVVEVELLRRVSSPAVIPEIGPLTCTFAVSSCALLRSVDRRSAASPRPGRGLAVRCLADLELSPGAGVPVAFPTTPSIGTGGVRPMATVPPRPRRPTRGRLVEGSYSSGRP